MLTRLSRTVSGTLAIGWMVFCSPSGAQITGEAAPNSSHVATPQPSDVSPQVSTSKVADEQWPYDKRRFIMLLAAAQTEAMISRHAAIKPTTVGVMDVGLADSAGAPLPPSVFAPDPVAGDDDIGPRPVAMCPSLDPGGVQALSVRDERFSHGAVTASLVAGLDLKGAPFLTSSVLPRVLFYSIFGPSSPCPPQDAPSSNFVTEGDAFNRLSQVSTVINSSWADTTNDGQVATSMRDTLASKSVILVTSAGDYGDNLDLQDGGHCPACIRIAGSSMHNDSAALRTIVVGSAGPELARSGQSNYGQETVQIYAPGIPDGALDLAGNDAARFKDSTTSWAAPYVARAIALIEALGGLDPDQAAHRAMLSVWPLLGDNGQPLRTSKGDLVGVLDLTKAAAVRTYAIEAMEKQPDGRLALRTYVGNIPGGLQAINGAICPQFSIDEEKWQALWFDHTDTTTTTIVAFSRWPRPDNFRQYRVLPYEGCQPSGEVHIEDLAVGDVFIPVSAISRILTPVHGLAQPDASP